MAQARRKRDTEIIYNLESKLSLENDTINNLEDRLKAIKGEDPKTEYEEEQNLEENWQDECIKNKMFIWLDDCVTEEEFDRRAEELNI